MLESVFLEKYFYKTTVKNKLTTQNNKYVLYSNNVFVFLVSNKKNLMLYKNPDRDSSPVEKHGNEK